MHLRIVHMGLMMHLYNVYEAHSITFSAGASLELAQSLLDDVDGQHDVRDGQITMEEFKT